VEGDHDVCVRHPERFTDGLRAACLEVRDRIGTRQLAEAGGG
jgi:hypothetical protein